MTTICYRDGELAADTAIFDRDCYCGETVKIVKGPAGQMGGAAGCFGDLILFQNWVENGGDVPEFKDTDSEGILISPAGHVEWIGHGGKRIMMTAPFHAIGSGFRIALGAMHAGASARRAVEIAAALDCYTRAPITVLKLGD